MEAVRSDDLQIKAKNDAVLDATGGRIDILISSGAKLRGIEYKKISYGTEILHWLENCCAESAKFPLVRETLVQYANLIRNYTGESMSAKATAEIIKTI